MGDPTPRGSSELKGTLGAFLGLRMIVLALVVGAGIMIAQLSQDHFSVRPLYVLLLVSYVAGGVLYVATRLGLDPVTGTWITMITDVLLETGILHYGGGASSPFALIFGFSIIAAAFLLRAPGGLGIALLACVCYVGYGTLQGKGILEPAETHFNGDIPTPGFLKTYMHVSLFFIVGAVSSYFSERIRHKGRLLHTAEAELKQLRVDTNRILNDLNSGVIVTDREGRILTLNPTGAEILGVDLSLAQSSTVAEVCGYGMRRLADELMAALETGTGKQRHEIIVERRNGSRFPLGVSLSVLGGSSGDRRGVIALFQDLTTVRDMEERVRKADRLAAIGELSAGIAHEIRNPLASISGSIEMLSSELELDGENRRLMELITKESERLDRIIGDFLDYARLRAPARNEVSVDRCLDDVIVLLKNSAAIRCNIERQKAGGDEEIIARLDEEHMKQVFFNLAINACEAMGKGVLVIRVERFAESGLTISFIDEGRGISEEAKSRLFEPFFTTKDDGTGLGLAIANKIVEAHGGHIEARNLASRGAEFTIRLPEEAIVQPLPTT